MWPVGMNVWIMLQPSSLEDMKKTWAAAVIGEGESDRDLYNLVCLFLVFSRKKTGARVEAGSLNISQRTAGSNRRVHLHHLGYHDNRLHNRGRRSISFKYFGCLLAFACPRWR